LRQAEAIAREQAAADAERARRQARLNLGAAAGKAAPPSAAQPFGALADPSLFAQLAVLGVLGASAVAALGSDASPFGEASAGSAAPAPAAPAAPGPGSGSSATGTN